MRLQCNYFFLVNQLRLPISEIKLLLTYLLTSLPNFIFVFAIFYDFIKNTIKNYGKMGGLGQILLCSIKDKDFMNERIIQNGCRRTPFYQGEPFASMSHVTHNEVRNIISSMSSKTSSVDFIPISLIKLCPSVFSELISRLANLSFAEGIFPTKFKTAAVLPL